MEIEDIKKQVAAIIKEELAGLPYSAFFFGSRIAGDASPVSDIDVGIEGERPLPQGTLHSIKARSEALRTLYTIDVVDFSATSEEFKKIAKGHTEKIM